MTFGSKTRYQESSVYVKAYRWLRYKPTVPYYALRGWWFSRKLPEFDDEGFPKFTFKQHWSIARGIASMDMNHVYTMEEVFSRIGEKLNNDD